MRLNSRHLSILQLTGWLLVSIVLILPAIVLADEVRLKDGNSISGKISSMDGKKLIMETSFAGKIHIDWNSVSGIMTHDPVYIQLDDGMSLKGVVDQDKGMTTVSGETSETIIPLSSITSISLKDKNALTSEGHINASIDTRTGNTEKERYDLDTDIALNWRRNRLLVGNQISFEKERGVTTVDKDTFYLEYNRFLTKKWYVVANSFAERDEFKDLNFRSGLGAGLGHQFFKTDSTRLSIELGPSYVYEEGKTTGIEQWISVRWKGVVQYWLLPDKLQFFHEDSIYIDTSGDERHFLFTKTGFRVPLYYGITVSLQYDWDLDNRPQGESEKIDTRLRLKLGYSWR